MLRRVKLRRDEDGLRVAEQSHRCDHFVGGMSGPLKTSAVVTKVEDNSYLICAELRVSVHSSSYPAAYDETLHACKVYMRGSDEINDNYRLVRASSGSKADATVRAACLYNAWHCANRLTPEELAAMSMVEPLDRDVELAREVLEAIYTPAV
jgi:hypothetical protein